MTIKCRCGGTVKRHRLDFIDVVRFTDGSYGMGVAQGPRLQYLATFECRKCGRIYTQRLRRPKR